MRLLIECTFVFEHPWIHSGIQRVVRNVLANLPNDGKPACIPVIFKNGALQQVIQFPSSEKRNTWLFRLNTLFSRISRIPARIFEKLDRSSFFRRVLAEKAWMRKLRKTLQVFAGLPLYLLQFLTVHYVDRRFSVPLQVEKQDVLVLLDSSWSSDSFALVEQYKQQGVQIVAVIYDVISITHPQFFRPHPAQVFKEWFAWIASQADGFMCISKFVQDETQKELLKYAPRREPWFSYFYLGADLDRSSASGDIRPLIHNMCAERPVYLMVSTIEPRKNHAYLLDAFDILWGQGIDVSLCFIGRVGWKCERTIERAKNHQERDRRLFLLHDVDDSELEYCYRHARALVFPSFVEGFGLPLVEAMERGLPVMASDIPVFREICEDFAAYFDLDDPASLAGLVLRHIQDSSFPASRPLEEWTWPDWSSLTAQFILRITANIQTAKIGENHHPLEL